MSVKCFCALTILPTQLFNPTLKPRKKLQHLTYLRKMWISLCFCGLTVAWNSGRNTFSSILEKLGTSFFVLKMSLEHTSTSFVIFCSEISRLIRNVFQLQVCIQLFLFRPPNSLYSGHLNHPPHVGRVYFMVNEPLGQIVPLIWRATVDGKAWLCMLVLTLLQIVGDFLLRVRGTVCFGMWEMGCISSGWLLFTKPFSKI